MSPGPVRLPAERRRPGQPPRPGALERATAAVTAGLGRLLHRRGTPAGSSLLELAGLRSRPQDFIFLVIVGSVVALALGLLLGRPLLAVLLAALVPVVVRLVLGLRVGKRQKAFADQLDDVLQLMASNLRAGHSLPQALASVAREAETPTAEELTRVVNETRVGRDLGAALELTARRMGNEDFRWVTQAVVINREVGGNLADVLDGVAHTIRERNQIRRHVAALSAEGRLSAVILMVMPVGVGGFLLMTNPGYVLAPLVAAASPSPVLTALFAVVALVGYFLPELLLNSNGQKRNETIGLELADTLDQMSIAVEAGLGFDSAMSRVAQDGTGPLSEELARTLQDIRMGLSRRQAFTALTARTTAPDLRRFVRAIIQADSYGISVADVLRTQAGEMRLKRRQRAEEKAQKVPVKVLMPLMLCILPVLFIVVLGPAVINIIDAFSGM